MTCEQFVFWLSGYLTGGRENDPDSVVQDIKEVIKTVVNPNLQKVIAFHGSE